MELNEAKYNLVLSDYVITPEWCAQDIIEWFKPSGKILDPSAGLNKVFYNNLLVNNTDVDYCEIQENIDFFKYTNEVDWIVGNPPYSIFDKWMKHSYTIADNIVYLLPTFKIFNALGLCRQYKLNGWIKHIRLYDVGKKIEWARSRPIVAAHFVKNYKGDTSWSFY